MGEFLMVSGLMMAVLGLMYLALAREEVGGGVALIGVFVLFIGGVIDSCSNPDYFETYKDKATQEEIIILETLHKYNSCTVNGAEVKKAISERSVKRSEGSASFSDIKSVVLFYDNALKCKERTTTIQRLYKGVYDKELFGEVIPVEDITSVIEEVEKTITPTPEQINEQVVDATVTLKDAEGNKQTLLSAEEVIKLTETISKCGRAKDYLMPLTGPGKYLAVKDYETATRLNLDCAYAKMENEFNK